MLLDLILTKLRFRLVQCKESAVNSFTNPVIKRISVEVLRDYMIPDIVAMSEDELFAIDGRIDTFI